MTTVNNYLKAPGHNPTPRRVVAHTPGMVCLDTTCVTPACRWYTLADVVAANDRATVAAALKASELELVQGCAEPPKTTALAIWRPVIELPIDMLGYYKEGSRKRAIPGLVLHMTDALIVLRPPAEWAA